VEEYVPLKGPIFQKDAGENWFCQKTGNFSLLLGGIIILLSSLNYGQIAGRK
jgi:hypothetical protein